MSLFAKKSYIGVDFGHHKIKVAQVEKTPIGWRVSQLVSAPTPAETVKDGIVVDIPVLGLALKHLLKASHINATNASIAVSGGSVVVRPVRIPKMAESALRKSIRYEASRYVPNSVEDSYIEFEICGEANAQEMDILVAAAPKEIVQTRQQACEASGLEVETVEIGAFAVYRALVEANHLTDLADKTVAIADIGGHATNISIVNKGAFSMTRTIPAGGQVFTDALKGYFKLNDHDAETGKAQLDVSQLIEESKTMENPPLRVLHSHLDDLVREVRRSINYWQSQQGEGPASKHVDAIFLTGGGARLNGIAAYFQHKLSVPTQVLDAFQNPRLMNGTSSEENGLEFALAIGLAMATQPAKSSAKSVGVSRAQAAPVEGTDQVATVKPGRFGKKPARGPASEEITSDAPGPVVTEDKPSGFARLFGRKPSSTAPIPTLDTEQVSDQSWAEGALEITGPVTPERSKAKPRLPKVIKKASVEETPATSDSKSSGEAA